MRIKMKKLAKLFGAVITLTDVRTGVGYSATIDDVKTEWGKIRITLMGGTSWFEPTMAELRSAGYIPD